MKHSWQRKKPQASHADDWLMTYADMITLLLCFFAIFLVVSAAKKNTTQKPPAPIAAETAQLQPPVPLTTQPPPIQSPIELPVKMPDILQGNLPFHNIEEGDDEADQPPAQPLPEVKIPVPVVADVPLVKAEAPPLPVAAAAPTAAALAPAPATLDQIIDNLKSQGNANIEQKGDRITTLEVSSAAFFGSGSATLSEAGKSILQGVAVNLKSDRFKDYQVTVEGHTDDSPIHTTQFPSNWELSTARASAVVHFFLEQGVSARKLRAAGYADTFPKVPNRDAAGNPIPANQAQNRRVVIKLEKIEKGAIPGD